MLKKKNTRPVANNAGCVCVCVCSTNNNVEKALREFYKNESYNNRLHSNLDVFADGKNVFTATEHT